MSLPGFTADMSLYTSLQRYHTATTFGQSGRIAAISPSLVLPAACDQECRANCSNSCSSDCLDLVGSAKGACLRRCRNELKECEAACGC